MFFDFLFLAALVFGVFKGIKDGFFVSIVAFLSLLIGTMGALKFSTVVKSFIQTKWGWESSFLPLLSFIIAFALAVLAAKFVAKAVTKMFDIVMLGFFNRIAGALFQIFVVILMSSLVFALFDQFNDKFDVVKEETLMGSKAYQVYLFVSEYIFPSMFKMISYLFEKSVDVIKTPTPTSV